MNNKENWVEQVLQSLDGIQRAQPADHVFSNIEMQLPIRQTFHTIPIRQLSWIAVAACVLITLNIYVFTLNSASTSESTQSELITDYSLYK